MVTIPGLLDRAIRETERSELTDDTEGEGDGQSETSSTCTGTALSSSSAHIRPHPPGGGDRQAQVEDDAMSSVSATSSAAAAKEDKETQSASIFNGLSWADQVNVKWASINHQFKVQLPCLALLKSPSRPPFP